MDTPLPTAEPSLGRAIGAVAGTAIDQVRDLAVAQLDEWAGRLHDRLADAPAQEPVPKPSAITTPLVIGALAGATVAWLLAARRPGG